MRFAYPPTQLTLFSPLSPDRHAPPLSVRELSIFLIAIYVRFLIVTDANRLASAFNPLRTLAVSSKFG